MSSVIARRVASTPVRTASATWDVIAQLLAPDPSSDARLELEAVAGVASAAIASESTGENAIVCHGGGPRVRVYCLFGDDAVAGEQANEDPLPRTPTGDGWALSIPFPEEDVEWASNKLTRRSTRVTARAVGTAVDEEKDDDAAPARDAVVDVEEFLRS